MSRGFFFEDYQFGQMIRHAVPRSLTVGEKALYHALYPARHALSSSDAFAASCGLEPAPLDEWIVFHTVFGKTVPDISRNAVANLGYAEGRWLAPVYAGDTLRSESEVIGLKQTSSGKTGIVWVRTTGLNQRDEAVLSFVRWVMVRRRAPGEAPETVVPQLAEAVGATDLIMPSGLDFRGYDPALAGGRRRWGDFEVGEIIDHAEATTIEEAEHMMATRLWQNTARVHFDGTAREDGRRLVYGGHVISLARCLSYNGLEGAQPVVALNAGSHVAPCFAGDTVTAWSEVLDKAEIDVPGAGALRLRLVAARSGGTAGVLRDGSGAYAEGILLDLDLWTLFPS